MLDAKENLNNLTFSFLNTPTENVCDPLNIDIRIGEEITYCLKNTYLNNILYLQKQPYYHKRAL